MRLFVGIEVPYETRRNLELLLQLLQPKARIQWSPLKNIHITTKFIGDWPDDELGVLREALADVPVTGDLRISIQGLGWFPNPHQPRVFFAGVQGFDGLKDLARETDLLCTQLDIPPELKPYHPHLTLARIKGPTDLAPMQKAISELPSTEFGTFTATHFHLYESVLTPGGSTYSKRASFPLTK
jgi:2'-5' RNA ligase